jgi:hypothetical protein
MYLLINFRKNSNHLFIAIQNIYILATHDLLLKYLYCVYLVISKVTTSSAKGSINCKHFREDLTPVNTKKSKNYIYITILKTIWVFCEEKGYKTYYNRKLF